MEKYCENCGSFFPETVIFCSKCGNPVTKRAKGMGPEPNQLAKKPKDPGQSSIPQSRPQYQRTEPEHFRGYYDQQTPQYGWNYYAYQQPIQQNYYNPYQYYYPPPPLYYPPPSTSRDIRRIFAGIVTLPSYVFLGIILIINLISLIIGIQFVFPALSTNSALIVIPYPWPNFLFPIELSGGLSIIWYSFIVVSIILSVAWLIKTEGKDFMNLFFSSAKKIFPPPSKSKNSFVIIAQCFFALWFFNIIIVLFLVLFSSPGDSPVAGEDIANWEIFFALANASVAEEVFTRILYIGLPLLVVDYFIRKKPKKIHQYFLGGGFEMNKITVFLIVFSSLTFGFAHYPGWGLWKVFPTTAAGLALGYLFTKKGIHTSIILHFLVNYMSMILYVFEGNIAVYLMLAAVLGIMMFVWFFAGIVYFGVYLNEIYDYITLKLFGPTLNPQPVDANTGDINYVKVTSITHDHNIKGSENERGTDKGPIEVLWHTDYRLRDHQNQFENIPGLGSQPPTPTGYGLPEGIPNIEKPGHDKEYNGSRYCPWCNSELLFIRQNGYWYCNRCYRYII